MDFSPSVGGILTYSIGKKDSPSTCVNIVRQPKETTDIINDQFKSMPS